MSRVDPQRIADYRRHILEAIGKTQDAVVRNLEVIGEASSNVPKQHAAFADAHLPPLRAQIAALLKA
jgi:uncharacterized protein with HEPN domain